MPAFTAYGEIYRTTTLIKGVGEDGCEQTYYDEPLTTPHVHLLFKIDRRLNPIIIAFPIGEDRPIHRPAFYVVPKDHAMLQRSGTHIVFDNGNWVLCRPIEAVYNKVLASLQSKDLYFVENMRTLMAHAYLCDLIDDDTLEAVSNGIDKLAKIAAKADTEANTNQAEVDMAWEIAQRTAGKILSLLKK